VLRRVRYIFNLKDKKVVAIFQLANRQVTEQQVQNWLLKDDDQAMVPLADVELASFLNGFIIEKRGKRDGEQPVAETTLTKNLILMKLKIALTLQNDDVSQLLKSVGFTVGKAELTALFRKPDHKNYRHCKSQFLRNFLQALQDKYRQKPPQTEARKKVADQKKTATPKKHYVNPNASVDSSKSTRKVLKLKPEEIYKNSQ